MTLKNICTVLLIMIAGNLSAQTYYAQIVTIKKDTINVQITVENDLISDNGIIAAMQDKFLVVNQGKYSGEYTAKDLLSFKVKIKDKRYTFDSIDGLFFAERLYMGNVKLYKYFKTGVNYSSGYAHNTLFRTYFVIKPKDKRLFMMTANGFSRLLTKDEMRPVFADCKSTLADLENDVIKVKNEARLVEFVKAYELACH